MIIKKTFLSLLLSIVIFACNAPSKAPVENEVAEKDSSEATSKNLSESELFVQSIEDAHYMSELLKKDVIQFDLNLAFGGKSRFNGTISMTPNGSFVKMEDSSKTIIWDGKEVYLSPDTANSKGARFGVLTWSYFFLAPFKLSDQGTNMELMGEQALIVENSSEDSTSGQKFIYNSGRLTFDEGVGDSPDDWYVVYQDKESNLLACLAYVVTYGKSLEKAEQDPHAISYEAYAEVDGIPFATQWNFWTWNEQGEMDKLLGEAVISNIKFIKKTDDLFKPSANSVLVEKPEA